MAISNEFCGRQSSCSANHFDGQIFTPPNHLNDDGSLRKRPVIKSVSPADAKPGSTIKIKTDIKILEDKASIICYGSATHTVDTDQRRLSVSLSRSWNHWLDWSGYLYEFQIPEELGVAAPGYYMVFVLDDKGTPSKSKNVRVAVA